jgi:hypothetical protein
MRAQSEWLLLSKYVQGSTSVVLLVPQVNRHSRRRSLVLCVQSTFLGLFFLGVLCARSVSAAHSDRAVANTEVARGSQNQTNDHYGSGLES